MSKIQKVKMKRSYVVYNDNPKSKHYDKYADGKFSAKEGKIKGFIFQPWMSVGGFFYSLDVLEALGAKNLTDTTINRRAIAFETARAEGWEVYEVMNAELRRSPS